MYETWSYRFGMRKDGSGRWLIGSWYWWRHNHNLAFWTAVLWTFRASILSPLNNFRCRIINRTYGRWKMNRLRKMWKKEFGEDIFD